MQIKKWTIDCINSDFTGNSSHFILINDIRYFGSEIKEITNLHNKEIKYLQDQIDELKNDLAGEDL